MTLTLGITAYRETRRGGGQWLLECIEPALTHDLVDEILIIEDGSEDWIETAKLLPNHPKIRFVHLGANVGVFGAKVASVCYARGDWVQLCDSDNRMDKPFLDRLAQVLNTAWEGLWICPSFGKDVFDYRPFASEEAYRLADFAKLIGRPMFECVANSGNQCVHRASFDAIFRRYLGLRPDLQFPNWLNFEDRTQLWCRLVFDALDSFILNLTWLTTGGRLLIVPGLEYFHRLPDNPNDGNYNRSPAEKEALGKFLLTELKRRAECQA